MKLTRLPETEAGIQSAIGDGLRWMRWIVEETSSRLARFLCPRCGHRDWKVRCIACMEPFTPSRKSGCDPGIGDLLASDADTCRSLPAMKLNLEIKGPEGTASPEQYASLEASTLLLVRSTEEALPIAAAYQAFLRAAVERCPEELGGVKAALEQHHHPPQRRKGSIHEEGRVGPARGRRGAKWGST